MDDTDYVKVVCPEGSDPTCVEGWTGGDFDDWYSEERRWEEHYEGTELKSNKTGVVNDLLGQFTVRATVIVDRPRG